MTSSAPKDYLQAIDINVGTGTSTNLAADTPRQRVLTFIERTLCDIVRDIQARPCAAPAITLTRIIDVQTSISPDTLDVQRQIIDREVTYRFPGNRKGESWRFGMQQEQRSDLYVPLTEV